MVHYLSVIRKSEFTDLFKYGKLYINHCVTFDGELSKHGNDYQLFDFLTHNMTMFEYSFEYLVIHFHADKFKGPSFLISISDVDNIYAFDNEAKKEMSISFDPRIQIQVSPWAEWFGNLQNNLYFKQCLQGIDNIWNILNLDEKEKEICSGIITKEIISEVIRQLFAYERPGGDQSLWIYLLRYERHSMYPKNIKGYFYDFIHVTCNWNKKIELYEDIAETTEVSKKLIDAKLEELVSLVKGSNIEKITTQATQCNFYIVAPLFLYYKSVFADGLDLDLTMNGYSVSDFIKHCKENYRSEFAICAYLLGLTLGYDKTYNSYYDSTSLPIFRKKEIQNRPYSEPDVNGESVSEPNVSFGDKGQKGKTAEIKNEDQEIGGVPEKHGQTNKTKELFPKENDDTDKEKSVDNPSTILMHKGSKNNKKEINVPSHEVAKYRSEGWTVKRTKAKK